MEPWMLWNILFLCVFLPLLIEWTQQRDANQFHALKIIRRKRKGQFIMSESLRRFIGKECVITVMSVQGTVNGVVEAVEDNWLLLRGKNAQQPEMVNVEYISRIQERKAKKANG